MSLLDDLPVRAEPQTWALADDPEDDAPPRWPEDESEPDPPLRS